MSPAFHWLHAVTVLASIATMSGCGKKGPPLAPIVRIPAGIEQLDARRVGSDVYVTVTIPGQNVDSSAPADVGKVEVYGYTGRTPPARARWRELGALVATVPVAAPPAPGDEPANAPGVDEPEPSARQGMAVTVRDALTADELVQQPTAVPEAGPRQPATVPVPVNETAASIRRFYVAIPWSSRGRSGVSSGEVEVALAPVPDAPAEVRVSYTEKSLAIQWEPSGGLVGYLLERPLLKEPNPDAFEVTQPAAESAESVDAWTGPTRYNVYRVSQDAPVAREGSVATEPWQDKPAVPLNAEGLTTNTFTDAITFGPEHCYAVRAIRGSGRTAVEGELSEPACVVPVDFFPPAAPASLAAVAAEGAISLIWEPNQETDLGGYMVLRGTAGDATLQPLTRTPLAEARFRDTTVTPGTRYTYAVVAVDKRPLLPNVSAESNRVEETAR